MEKKQQGFTLVEVIIASMLFVLVMGGAYTLISRTGILNRVARNHYLAVNIAKNRLERARAYDYADLNLLSETCVLVNENGDSDLSGKFRRTTLVNTNYGLNLTLVQVTLEIRNMKTGAFVGEQEVASCLYTEYVEP